MLFVLTANVFALVKIDLRKKLHPIMKNPTKKKLLQFKLPKNLSEFNVHLNI